MSDVTHHSPKTHSRHSTERLLRPETLLTPIYFLCGDFSPPYQWFSIRYPVGTGDSPPRTPTPFKKEKVKRRVVGRDGRGGGIDPDSWTPGQDTQLTGEPSWVVGDEFRGEGNRPHWTVHSGTVPESHYPMTSFYPNTRGQLRGRPTLSDPMVGYQGSATTHSLGRTPQRVPSLEEFTKDYRPFIFTTKSPAGVSCPKESASASRLLGVRLSTGPHFSCLRSEAPLLVVFRNKNYRLLYIL